MRRRILPLAVAVIVLGFAVFGLINRFTYTDITSEPGYLECSQSRRCVRLCRRLR